MDFVVKITLKSNFAKQTKRWPLFSFRAFLEKDLAVSSVIIWPPFSETKVKNLFPKLVFHCVIVCFCLPCSSNMASSFAIENYLLRQGIYAVEDAWWSQKASELENQCMFIKRNYLRYNFERHYLAHINLWPDHFKCHSQV